MRLAPRHWLAGGLAFALASVLYVCAPDGASAATTNTFLYATGAGPGAAPHVQVFKAPGQEQVASFYAYGESFPGGVNVAMGDIDGDGDLEVITGAGAGGGPHVRVFTDKGAPYKDLSFFAYPSGFNGGVRVGVADLDGDGDKEILTAPGPGAMGPLIHAYNVNPTTGALSRIREFYAYGTNWVGGVFIAGAYVDNSDVEGMVTGAGPGGGPHVRTWKPDASPLSSWFAYDPAYKGGVSVGSYYVDDKDTTSEIVTGALSGRGHVRGWNINGQFLSTSFYAYDAGVDTGVQINGGLSGGAVGPFIGGPFRSGGLVRSFTLQGAGALSATPYAAPFNGGVSVASGFGAYTDPPPPTTTTTAPSSTTSSSTTSSTSTTTSTSTTSSSTTSTTVL